MGYRLALVRRWTRRDRLAVVVIAVTVAFFTGATLVVAAVAAQTSQMAAEYGPVGYATTTQSATTLPVAALADGGTYLGIPNGTAFEHARASLPVAEYVTHGPGAGSRVTLAGTKGRVTTLVRPRTATASLVPGDWYTGPARVAADLGQTGVIGLRSSGALTASHGVPLRGALAFFVLGTQSLLGLLRVLTLGAGVLVAVTVYSVVRMTVRDRDATITVLRATGARRRDVLLPFVARGVLLTVVGVLLGYAVGVVLPNAAVNVAVFAGLPVSLSVRVTMPALATLLPGYAFVVLAGAVASALAVRPALSAAPLATTRRTRLTWLPDVVRPGLLGWRALVPAVSALTVFVTVTVLLASVGGALAPVFAPSGATVTESGATHPVASTVPAAYANAFRASGVAASPEILAFSVVNGTPFLSRGARYAAFANVTEAHLVAGRQPNGRHEAVVGSDLARTLGVSVGDTLLLGGSTRAAFTRVEIVGRFEGSGLTDDQLVVSLPTARHLTGKPPGAVQFVRLSRPPQAAVTGDGIRVVSLAGPETATVGEPVTIRADVVNIADTGRTRTLELAVGNRTLTRRVSVPPGALRTVAFEASFQSAGRHELHAGNASLVVHATTPSALRVSPLPDRAPPNSTLVVHVRTATGSPRQNATVTLGDTTVRVGRDGTVRVRVPSQPGDYTVTVTASTEPETTAREPNSTGNETVTRPLTVSTEASKRLLVSAGVSPAQPSLLTRPTVTLTAVNPWSEPLRQQFAVTPPGRTVGVRVPPGDSVERSLQLDRRAPGQHSVVVLADGSRVASATYRVTGDERLVAAIATRTGGTRGTGIGRAVQTVFGNLQVLLGTFVALGALVTIGSVTAGFAYAVRARRETIGVLRATGARPRRILSRVLGDAVRVGGVAMALALAAGYAVAAALHAAGYTTMFGIRIAPRVDPVTLAVVTLGGLGVVVVGALVAAYPLAHAEPHRLLDGTWGEDA